MCADALSIVRDFCGTCSVADLVRWNASDETFWRYLCRSLGVRMTPTPARRPWKEFVVAYVLPHTCAECHRFDEGTTRHPFSALPLCPGCADLPDHALITRDEARSRFGLRFSDLRSLPHRYKDVRLPAHLGVRVCKHFRLRDLQKYLRGK